MRILQRSCLSHVPHLQGADILTVSVMCRMCRELTYYEKWARSLATILKERGTVQQAELDAVLGNKDVDLPAVR